MISNNERKIDDLYTVVEELPAEQKAELVKRLLKSSDLNVTFGNNQLSGTIIVQINAMDQTALGDILQAIATRISTETTSPNNDSDNDASAAN